LWLVALSKQGRGQVAQEGDGQVGRRIRKQPVTQFGKGGGLHGVGGPLARPGQQGALEVSPGNGRLLLCRWVPAARQSGQQGIEPGAELSEASGCVAGQGTAAGEPGAEELFPGVQTRPSALWTGDPGEKGPLVFQGVALLPARQQLRKGHGESSWYSRPH